MTIVLKIIKKAIKKTKEKRKVFIIDGYSSEYDNNNILKEIKNLIYETKSFFFEIIYDIKNQEDAELLYKNLNPNNNINYNMDNPDKFYYFEKLKLFSEIKKNLEKNEIPEKYTAIFGENVSYFFEYVKNNDKTFDDFVKEKNQEIKNEILNFLGGNSKLYLNEIIHYIETKRKFLYENIIKYVPTTYIKIIIEPKQIQKNWGEDLRNEKFPKLYSI